MNLVEEYPVRCCWCGFALKEIEIAGEIMGRYIDYETHQPGDISVVFCSECWKNIKDRQNETMMTSIQRRKRAFGGDQ